jgi:hypothetical protein
VGAAVRIAGALHAVKCAHAQTAIEGAVDGETMRAAVKIVEEYFLPHSQAAIAEMGADPAIDKARRVVAWLQSHDGADFSVRDLHQEIRGQGCFRTVRSVEETLELVTLRYQSTGAWSLSESSKTSEHCQPSSAAEF